MPAYSERLATLRTRLAQEGLDGFVVPLTDEHMSEYVGAYAQRLAWLTGFQGSAGTAVVLPQDAVDALMRDAGHGANARITVDLERQVVTGADGTEYPFQIDPHRRHNMLEGLDDIGLTLAKSAEIGGYEQRIAQSQPWV